MRIAIVNDSVMAVESLRRVVQSSAEHQVAWVARDGAEAVWRCTQETPDLILMDLIMPVMDGVEATRRIMASTPCPIVVVTATVAGNAAKVFQAMGEGALDAVNTPVLGISGEGEGRAELLAKITTIQKLIRQKRPRAISIAPTTIATSQPTAAKGKLIAIGASSGGPPALAKVLSALPRDFDVPVVIVQHVDAQFVGELALWLDKQCQLSVRLARDHDELRPGQVLVAGSNNDHLVMTPEQRLAYTPHPVEQAYRPSVDVFFESLASHWQGELVAVLLTGMGRDGAQGLLQLRSKGVFTIAQDKETSAVYGMPKAAVQLDAAVEILPIDAIGPRLQQCFRSYPDMARKSLV